jgi:hypothetical protein
MKTCRVALTILLSGLATAAQQVSDPNFKYVNATPAFSAGAGQAVCIDEAHNNFHTAEGRYEPFASLVRGDGFRVQRFTAKFTADTLKSCNVLVIANALADENGPGKPWSYPHPSAFTREEVNAVFTWIREGGSILLIADHAPFSGAASGLASMLGAVFADGYASIPREGPLPDVFSVANGQLKPHAIVKGRSASETIDTVGTFTGSAFQVSPEFTPILALPKDSVVAVPWGQNFGDKGPPQSEWPLIPATGWLQGAARPLGKGRVMILGEAAMCSAQLAGPQGAPMGMNNPRAPQNPLFCLNTVRWLARVIEPAAR